MRKLEGVLAILLGAAPMLVPLAVADVPSPDPLQWHTCKPELAYISFGNQFEVKCDAPWTFSYSSTPPGEYAYSVSRFSISTKKADWVAQAMATVHTAQISGKKVKIHFKFNASENPSGCNPDSCRSMVGIGVAD